MRALSATRRNSAAVQFPAPGCAGRTIGTRARVRRNFRNHQMILQSRVRQPLPRGNRSNGRGRPLQAELAVPGVEPSEILPASWPAISAATPRTNRPAPEQRVVEAGGRGDGTYRRRLIRRVSHGGVRALCECRHRARFPLVWLSQQDSPGIPATQPDDCCCTVRTAGSRRSSGRCSRRRSRPALVDRIAWGSRAGTTEPASRLSLHPGQQRREGCDDAAPALGRERLGSQVEVEQHLTESPRTDRLMRGSHHHRQPLRRTVAEQDLRSFPEPVHGEVAADAEQRRAVAARAGSALPPLHARALAPRRTPWRCRRRPGRGPAPGAATWRTPAPAGAGRTPRPRPAAPPAGRRSPPTPRGPRHGRRRARRRRRWQYGLEERLSEAAAAGFGADRREISGAGGAGVGGRRAGAGEHAAAQEIDYCWSSNRGADQWMRCASSATPACCTRSW